ncbi:uncharacterized protein LOC125075510 [Vanessa atalanta]|uniref:uncharacterized protein LOC125075510 n=1 Tax=Vanessa atalanta TaxID=42275 RepID=UPI001FCCFFCB|nr:uncharacterized protein LOC125075510 [Vanessa atalanta]
MATGCGTKDDQTGVENAASEICKVGVRVPPFWPDEPDIWFAQLEGQFMIAGITNDATKFFYVVSQLDRQYAREVKDIITNPPARDKYEKLKSELIRRLSASNEKKVQQLLMHEELGDRRPSQFHRHLQGLAGQEVTDEFLRTIWTSRLPANIQSILAAQPHASLDTLADLADRIHDIVPTPTQHVAATSSTNPGSSIESLAREVAELRRQLQSLTTRDRRPRSLSRTRSRPRSRSNSRYRKFPLCWYHSKFGSGAKKCVRPCDFKAAENFSIFLFRAHNS